MDGRRVRVTGWMRVGFERHGLWENRQASERGAFRSECVSLMIPTAMDLHRFDGHDVEVEGVFLAKLPPHEILLGGRNVTTLRLLERHPPVVVRPER